MATTTGAATTTNVLSDQLAIDLGDRISLLEPSAQPLAVFSRRAEKKKTVATKYSWLEDVSKARFATQSGGATSGALTIAVTSGQGTYFQQWDQVLNTRTSEQFRIDGVSGDTLTVTRGIGSTAAAMLNGDELYLIGTAQPENDTSKPSRFDVPSKVTNNTQIFRTPFEISGSLQASGFQASPAEWPRQARNKGIEHAKDIELTFLLGRKSATTPGATEDRTTGGVLSFITTNQTDAGGDLSEAEFNAFMLQVMRFGSGLEARDRVRGRRLGAEQVPGVEAADAERRDDVRHERHALHLAVRGPEPRLPPDAGGHEVRRLHHRRGHGGGRLPLPRERLHLA
jgi:hypothetical protein